MNDNGMMTADPYPARLTGIISYESSECLAISGATALPYDCATLSNIAKDD